MAVANAAEKEKGIRKRTSSLLKKGGELKGERGGNDIRADVEQSEKRAQRSSWGGREVKEQNPPKKKRQKKKWARSESGYPICRVKSKGMKMGSS